MTQKKGGYYDMTKSVTCYGFGSDGFCHFGMVVLVTDFVTTRIRGSEACAVWRGGCACGCVRGACGVFACVWARSNCLAV